MTPANHSAERAPHAGICANCHAALAAGQRFCAQCGQPARLHPPRALEFVHEFLAHYVALEGPLWRTLGRLFFAPGHLTRAWLDGRRTRYVSPLRLYLSISIVFFVALQLTTTFEVATVDAAAVPAQPLGERVTARGLAFDLGDSALATAIEARLAPLQARLAQRMASMTPHEAALFVGRFMLSKASYTMFFLLPWFVVLLAVVYAGRGWAAGVHAVFALHLHAFVFGLLLVLALPWPGALAGLLLALVPLYVVAALRAVYGGRWWTTLLRALALFLAYGAGFVLALLALAGSVLFAV